jgi:acyl carrier protein
VTIQTLNTKIRSVIEQHGRLRVDIGSLADDADLFEAGMTSHASVNVMLGLEDAFDIEFPDSMLKRSVFESIASIAVALQELNVEAAA